MQSAYVRAVCALRDRQGCAPTTGDVAAMMGISRTTAWRGLHAAAADGHLFTVPGNPAPTWHVRGGLAGAAARVHALVVEVGELVQHLSPADAETLRETLLAALAGREGVTP